MIDRSQRYAARIFGITFIVNFIVITLGFVRFYAPFLVWDHLGETARNLIAHEHLLRIYIVCAILYGIGNMVVLACLYIVLRPVSRGLAFIAAFSRLVYVSMWFIMLLNLLAALRIMGGGAELRALSPEHLQALGALRLATGWDAYYIGLTFYSLGTILFGWAFFTSRYVPRTLAALCIVASLFEGFCAFAYLVYPSFGKLVSVNYYEMPSLLELVIGLWILTRGLKQPQIA